MMAGARSFPRRSDELSGSPQSLLEPVQETAPTRDINGLSGVGADAPPEELIGSAAPRPYDDRLRVMLDAGTYSLASLKLGRRRPVKDLGAAIASTSCSQRWRDRRRFNGGDLRGVVFPRCVSVGGGGFNGGHLRGVL